MIQELLYILDELSEVEKVKSCTMTLRLESGVSITLKFNKDEDEHLKIIFNEIKGEFKEIKGYDPYFDSEEDQEWKEEDHNAED